MLDEYQAIERRLKDQETIVVLDVDGKVLSTEAIAESIGAWQDLGPKWRLLSAGQTVYTRNLRLGLLRNGLSGASRFLTPRSGDFGRATVQGVVD